MSAEIQPTGTDQRSFAVCPVCGFTGAVHSAGCANAPRRQATYELTYSEGTSRHDERRYLVTGIAESQLTARIARLTSQGRQLYSVRRETEFGA